ncbi:MAG: UvrB/UvrC motif-containing protein [Oscillospiraceae bacterium]|nr:UvrB/UvrC motif-containing protein [Oscillospiraceae bacterium]
MKCEHCGKNDVTFVYRSNMNGKVDEKHLCADCAEKLGYTKRVAAHNRAMMRNFFSDDFFGNSFFGNGFFDTPVSTLMGRMLESPFDDFFSDMPALMAAPAAQRTESEKPETSPAQDAEQNHYDQWRRLNALKLEMNRAVQEENFERAAEIRDELRRMEQQSNTNTDEQK